MFVKPPPLMVFSYNIQLQFSGWLLAVEVAQCGVVELYTEPLLHLVNAVNQREESPFNSASWSSTGMHHLLGDVSSPPTVAYSHRRTSQMVIFGEDFRGYSICVPDPSRAVILLRLWRWLCINDCPFNWPIKIRSFLYLSINLKMPAKLLKQGNKSLWYNQLYDSRSKAKKDLVNAWKGSNTFMDPIFKT